MQGSDAGKLCDPRVPRIHPVAALGRWRTRLRLSAPGLGGKNRNRHGLLPVCGHGFDTGEPPSGLGLQYMRQRAGEVGADLDVISAKGRGTTVQVRFLKRQKTPDPPQGDSRM